MAARTIEVFDFENNPLTKAIVAADPMIKGINK
jgi:hypothetical protein